MSSMHYFPLVEFAESKTISAGDILDALRQVPLEELAKMDISLKANNQPLSPYKALINLAMGFHELAGAVRSYQLAQEFRRDIAENGRLQP